MYPSLRERESIRYLVCSTLRRLHERISTYIHIFFEPEKLPSHPSASSIHTPPNNQYKTPRKRLPSNIFSLPSHPIPSSSPQTSENQPILSIPSHPIPSPVHQTHPSQILKTKILKPPNPIPQFHTKRAAANAPNCLSPLISLSLSSYQIIMFALPLSFRSNPIHGKEATTTRKPYYHTYV